MATSVIVTLPLSSLAGLPAADRGRTHRWLATRLSLISPMSLPECARDAIVSECRPSCPPRRGPHRAIPFRSRRMIGRPARAGRRS